jgi:hypothetical protein
MVNETGHVIEREMILWLLCREHSFAPTQTPELFRPIWWSNAPIGKRPISASVTIATVHLSRVAIITHFYWLVIFVLAGIPRIPRILVLVMLHFLAVVFLPLYIDKNPNDAWG